MVMGFTIVFAALFCKLWRINKIFNGARQFRKLRVTEKDVLRPFLFWLAVNSIVLAMRTGLGFEHFERVEIDGNPANTVATCQTEDGGLSWGLYAANVIVTLSAFFAAAYQAYQARGVSEEYSESRPLMVALFIWMEILAICVPVLYILQGDSMTTAYFVIVSTIFGLCMSMLSALFIPLWRQVRIQSGTNNTSGINSSAGDARSVMSHVHVTGLQEAGRDRTSDHDVVDDLRLSVALGATTSQKDPLSSGLSHTDSRVLLKKVADLETQIEQLRQRNQELESLYCNKGNGDNGT